MNYLVDTNVVSELPKRRPHAAVLAWFSSQETIAVSAITLEELSFGVERAPRESAARLRRWLDGLLAAQPLIFPVDERVARTAGLLRAAQEQSGRVAAQADMLIAATALTSGRILVTRNIKHFQGSGVALLDPFSLHPA